MEFGAAEGGFKHGGLRERFARTLEGVHERRKDEGSVAEKSGVKVYHTKKSLKSRFIGRQRNISDGGGVLGKGIGGWNW